MIAELPPCNYEQNREQSMDHRHHHGKGSGNGLLPVVWSASMLVRASPPAVSGLLPNGGYGGGMVEQLQLLRSAGIPAVARFGVSSRTCQDGSSLEAETTSDFVTTDCRGAIMLLNPTQRFSDAGAMAVALDCITSEAALGTCNKLSAPVTVMDSAQGQLVMLSELLRLDAGDRRRLGIHESYELLGEVSMNAISNYADDTTHDKFHPENWWVFYCVSSGTRSYRSEKGLGLFFSDTRTRRSGAE